MRHWLAALFITLVTLFPLPQRANAQVGEARSLEEVHAEWSSDTELQLERPEKPPEPPDPQRADLPDWLSGIFEFIGGIFSVLSPVLRVLFYMLLALGLGIVVWFMFGETLRARFGFQRRKREQTLESRAQPLRPDAAQARSLLDEADALAQQGRFAEAVHLLLFRSIEDVQRRREGGVPQSLTAREIGSLPALPGRARRALQPIISVVEHSFFGGREVDRSGWETARASYQDFAFGEAW